MDERVKGCKWGRRLPDQAFRFLGVLARVQALIRGLAVRLSRRTDRRRDLLDLLTRRSGGRAKIELQPREFALLEYLMRNAGRVVTKTMIMEHVWDYGFDPQTNVVDVLICRLRNKVDRDFENKVIQTIRGVGYVFRICK